MGGHSFHMVEYSPWPLTGSLGGFFLVFGTGAWMHGYSSVLMIMGLVVILLTMVQWWRDVTRESTFQGLHTEDVERGMRYGMVLFIVSEVCFFAAFFWAYYHLLVVSGVLHGASWPPSGVQGLDPYDIPLLNTVVLLCSGFTCTWSHHSLMEGDRKGALQGLFFTVLLGAYFTFLQAGEYYEASFSIADGIYGSLFFVATGFHGLHVIIGTTFLLVCFFRLYSFHFSSEHHFGFEAAAWYWHFVDVVWLFLFFSIYWLGDKIEDIVAGNYF